MEAILSVTSPEREPPLGYAARRLLEAAGVTMPVRWARAEDDRSAGLSVGRHRVTPAELEQVYRMMTLQRELDLGITDRLGRFEAAAATWDVSQPWVDVRAHQVATESGRTEETAGAGFQVIVTHDIDRTHPWEPACLLKALGQSCRPGRQRWLPLSTARSRAAFVRMVERLLDFEIRHGIGAGYFMMSGPYGLGRFGTRTNIRWRTARDIVARVQQAGMTVGLHGSFAARERDSYREEKERLEQVTARPVVCQRNHYLRFDARRLGEQLERAGVRYDFSVGFVARVGFRAGRGGAYPLYHAAEGRDARVIEVPLLFMDAGLREGDWTEALRELRLALAWAERVRGCVSLLFHPEFFLTHAGAWPFFERVIELCVELGADLSQALPRPRRPAPAAEPHLTYGIP